MRFDVPSLHTSEHPDHERLKRLLGSLPVPELALVLVAMP